MALAHQTGRGGSPCASRLPASQQLEVPAAAAPLESSPGTCAGADRKELNTPMLKRCTWGGHLTLDYNAVTDW